MIYYHPLKKKPHSAHYTCNAVTVKEVDAGGFATIHARTAWSNGRPWADGTQVVEYTCLHTADGTQVTLEDLNQAVMKYEGE